MGTEITEEEKAVRELAAEFREMGIAEPRATERAASAVKGLLKLQVEKIEKEEDPSPK